MFDVSGSGFRVQGSGFRIFGFGFSRSGFVVFEFVVPGFRGS